MKIEFEKSEVEDFLKKALPPTAILGYEIIDYKIDYSGNLKIELIPEIKKDEEEKPHETL
jgi:hypothetical protein